MSHWTHDSPFRVGLRVFVRQLTASVRTTKLTTIKKRYISVTEKSWTLKQADSSLKNKQKHICKNRRLFTRKNNWRDCVYDCVQLQDTIQHRTVLITFTLIQGRINHSGAPYQCKGGGPFSHTHSQDFLCGCFSGGALFFPPKVDNLF